MWRMRATAVSLVLMGALLFGSVVAYAGWGWNAKVDVGGTKISTSWAVSNDKNGAADYHADITLEVPANVDVNVVKVAPRESMTVLKTHPVACNDGVINAVVTYDVTSDGGNGTDVSVSIDRVGGGGKENYGSGFGQVDGDPITVIVEIMGVCNG